MKILYYLLGMALFFVACNGDDDADLSPTGETNWFVLEDSEDEVDHLAYTVFKESGFPIYYNDTIARIPVGQMPTGEEVFRYEVLAINYAIDTKTNYSYEYLTDRDDIKAGIEMLRDRVIPRLLPGMVPRSFFLTAKVRNTSGSDELGTRYDVQAYKALKTTCVNWGEEEKDPDDVAAAVLGVEYAPYLLEREEELPLLEEFYAKSEGNKSGKTVLLYEVQLQEGAGSGNSWNDNVETFGFLSHDKSKLKKPGGTKKKEGVWTAPSKSQDLAAYVKVVLLGDDEGFKAKYKKYKKCIQKYDLMKQIVDELQTAAK